MVGHPAAKLGFKCHINHFIFTRGELVGGGGNLLSCNSFFNACQMESFIGQCIVTHLHTKYINKALTLM